MLNFTPSGWISYGYLHTQCSNYVSSEMVGNIII